MNLLELKADVDFAIEHLRSYEKAKNIKVLVTLFESSMGSRASTEIKYASMGMDFEYGQFRLEPTNKIVRKGNAITDIKPVNCKKYEGRSYYFCSRCEDKISKNDNFCRCCGQKLK